MPNADNASASITIFVFAWQDDQPQIAGVVAEVLNYTLLGQTDSASDGLERCKTLLPDIVLVDSGVRDMRGVEIIARLTAMSQSINAVLMTHSNPPDLMREALLAGAKDFLTKPLARSELINAIHYIMTPGDNDITGIVTVFTFAWPDTHHEITSLLADVPLYSVVGYTGSLQDGIQQCRALERGAVLIERDGCEKDSIELAAAVQSLGKSFGTVIIFDEIDTGWMQRAQKFGASQFLQKPLNKLDLLNAIRYALSQSHS